MKTSAHKHDLKTKKVHQLHFSSRDNYQIIKCYWLVYYKSWSVDISVCHYPEMKHILVEWFSWTIQVFQIKQSLCKNSKHTDNGINSTREYGRHFYSPNQKEWAAVTISMLTRAWSGKWILNRYITKLLMTLMKQSHYSSSTNMKKVDWI